MQSPGCTSQKHGNNRPKTQKMGHFSHFLGPWWPYKELPRAFSLAHISYRECIGGYMATGAHSEPLTRPLGISLPLSGSNKQAWPVTHPSPRPPAPPMVSLERRTGGRAPTLARPTGRAPEGARPAGPQIKSLLWTQLRAPPKRLSNGHQGRWYFHLWVLSWHAGAVARHHVRWVH